MSQGIPLAAILVDNMERPEVTGRKVGDAATALDGDWIATPFRKWCRDAGISVSHGYNLVAQGKLKITHLGNRALMTRAESDRVMREGV